MGKNVFQPRTESEREFKKVLDSFDGSKNTYEVFTDFIFCCALTYAQVSHYTEEKEQRYLKIINKYRKEDRQKFADLMGILIRAYKNKDGSTKFGDIFLPTVCGTWTVEKYVNSTWESVDMTDATELVYSTEDNLQQKYRCSFTPNSNYPYVINYDNVEFYLAIN